MRHTIGPRPQEQGWSGASQVFNRRSEENPLADERRASDGLPAVTAPLAAAPVWRREPYRVFFPLGLLLAWAGVLHWLLHAVGVLPWYHSVFHAITQIQGFMMCFAVGFLFTAIPRRTGTTAPSAPQMVLAIAAPIGTTLSAWFELWPLSQAFWLVLVATLLVFVVSRFLGATAARRPPNSFVWVPVSLLMGTAGSVLIGIWNLPGAGSYALHEFGRLLLLQGMFVGLVLGIGGMVLPLITQGSAPPDATSGGRDLMIRIAHLAAAAVLITSFRLEITTSVRGGLALRAAVVLAMLLWGGGIWRWPRVPGWHRRLVWLSAWMIPAGYSLAALFPLEKKAGLHVVFIGGFAMMALSVGLHVTLAHGGFQKLMRGRPWQVPVFGGLLLVSVALRALVEFDPERFFLWLGAASACFLLATIFWGSLVLPRAWWPAGGEGQGQTGVAVSPPTSPAA